MTFTQLFTPEQWDRMRTETMARYDGPEFEGAVDYNGYRVARRKGAPVGFDWCAILATGVVQSEFGGWPKDELLAAIDKTVARNHYA